MGTPHTVVELPMFLAKAKKLMSDRECEDLVDFVAANYERGIVMSGGIRKIRVPRPGGGKSGGYRVVYYYATESVPVFLLTIYAKSEKDNLTKAEQNAMAEIGKRLLASYGV